MTARAPLANTQFNLGLRTLSIVVANSDLWDSYSQLH